MIHQILNYGVFQELVINNNSDNAYIKLENNANLVLYDSSLW